MKKINKIPELCVPAGNLKILKYAVAFGADAVYIGGRDFNLRNLGDNFNVQEIIEAVEYAHSRDVKIYLTLNSVIDENEIDKLSLYIKSLKDTGIDAVIISDLAVLKLIKEILPEIRVHISTQTSTSNHLAVDLWAGLGAKRVNIAREVSYDNLINIVRDSEIEIEVFVHGALCISYSGRCMLSKYLSGRDANKGACSHTCRWKYYLMEEKRQNMYLQIEQDGRGTYIYNSRDLCLLSKLDLIVDAKVAALKIEGRMKTESYVGLVTWVYRNALDLLAEGRFTPEKKKYFLNELDKTTHRSFTTGFMFLTDPEKNPELTENDNVGYIKKFRFIGTVEGYSPEYDAPIVRARNQFHAGDVLDILEPKKEPISKKIKDLLEYKTGSPVKVANTNDLLIIPGLGGLDKFSLLRVEI